MAINNTLEIVHTKDMLIGNALHLHICDHINMQENQSHVIVLGGKFTTPHSIG